MIATFLAGIISPASVVGLISLMTEDNPEDRMVGCAVLWYLRMINCILIQSVLLSNILFRYGSVDKIIVLVLCLKLHGHNFFAVSGYIFQLCEGKTFHNSSSFLPT